MKKKKVSQNNYGVNSKNFSSKKKRKLKKGSSLLLNKLNWIIYDVRNNKNILSNQTFYQIFELIEEILVLQKEKFPNDYKKSCEFLLGLMQIKFREHSNSYSDYSKELLNIRINIENDHENAFLILPKVFSLLELALSSSTTFREKFGFDLLKFFNEQLKKD